MGKGDKYANKKKKDEAEVPADAAASAAVKAPSAVKATSVAAKPKPNVSKVGTKGEPVTVEVNYFQMKTGKLLDEAFHYDLDFTPPGPKKFITQALEVFRKKNYSDRAFAFDGRKNVYTDKRLKTDELQDTVEVNTEDGKMKKYEIKIQFAAVVDLGILKDYKNPLPGDNFSQALQCLDIILKCRFKNTDAQSFGRQFYFPPKDGKVDLKEGMELYRGLFQSSVMGQKCLYLNADVLNKAVASPMHVLDYLKLRNRGQVPRTLNNYQEDTAAKHLKQLKICYQAKKTDPQRIKTILRLGRSAQDHTFKMEGSPKPISVLQYFKTKYGIQLQFPQLPLIQVMPDDKKIFLPMEFCTILAGQLNQKECSDLCKREMIRETAVSTDKRKQLIMDSSARYGVTDEMRQFGIEIEKAFEKVVARIIAKPDILYVGSVAKPNKLDGKWNGGNFQTKSQKDMKFGIICCEDISLPVVTQLKNDIANTAVQKGIKLAGDKIIQKEHQNFNDERVLTEFLSIALSQFKELEYNLAIVIICDKSNCYSKVKKIAETQLGILTQCLKPRCFFNDREMRYQMSFSTKNNIFLKINSKLNGINHLVTEPSYNAIVKTSSIMLIGADVTHPTAEQRDSVPSVAAVCASYDPYGMLYHSVWRLQKGGIDRIDDLEQIMVEQLNYFKLRNKNALPSKIIYYRDGVGDSQFEKFLGPETDSIKRACAKMYAQGMLPPITLIVVNKRHHMRAFPLPGQGDGTKFNNILPGTVVDKDIVAEKYDQFFLASHSALQGCSRPTKYTILLDEIGISKDDIESLTYCLCHMYVRCNRSVSYPNCTYYAHLMAFRAKHYIAGDLINLDDLSNEFKRRELKKNIVDVQPMFFV